jgi:SAM (Sterile alpha motif) domain-containing protein/adenylate/guanylate cyclase family protein
MDLGGWLRSLGLERYEAAFRENEIDEAVLPNLTAEDLKDLERETTATGCYAGRRHNAAEPLAIRIGIATGLVLLSSGESALVGDTPNLAARLQTLPEPGTIVVAASTRRLLGHLFRLRDLGRHEVKGIAEPVAAWAVEGVLGARFQGRRYARASTGGSRIEGVAPLFAALLSIPFGGRYPPLAAQPHAAAPPDARGTGQRTRKH